MDDGYSNTLSSNEPQQKTHSKTDVCSVWNPEYYLTKGYGGLPFPIEKTANLSNAYTVVSRCRSRTETMFFIHSAASHQVHRKVIRQFVGNATLSTAHDWTTVFFVGISKNRTVSRAVQEEATKYGDVVVLPYEDTYQNLTYKFVYGMKWTLEFCPSVKYIVKIDDDMVVNLVRVVRYIRRLHSSPGSEIHCYVWNRKTVHRETKSPWYLPFDVYPRDTFPDYCSGRGVFLKCEALRRLYSASFCVPFHGIDDVYVTGDAALWAKVGHVAINSELSQDGENWEGVVSGHVIFSHIHNHTLRAKAWYLIVREIQRESEKTNRAPG
ncbi:unnamed protein product [Ixodes persulcatus]